MSQHKRLLFVLEGLATLLGAIGLGLFVSALVGVTVPTQSDIAFISAFTSMLVVFVPAVLLSVEYGNHVRGGKKFEMERDGLSSSEIAELFTWAPAPYKIAAGLGLLMGVSAMLLAGPQEFTSTDALTRSQSYGLGGVLAFALLALPVLASAARMPGAYCDNFAVSFKKDA